MYVLKYNLKYALESTDESVITEAEKQQLRQAEYISKNISRVFWVYAPLDVMATGRWFGRLAAGTRGPAEADFIHSSLGRQSRESRLPLVALFLTLRLVAAYHLSSEMSKKYLADNVARILRKSNPRKDQVLEKMKGL